MSTFAKNSPFHCLEPMPILGLDVSKDKLDACLLLLDGSTQRLQVKNTTAGFIKLDRWVRKHTTESYFTCLESTGNYGRAVAIFLYSLELPVSVVNPLQTKSFAEAQMLRTKTDTIDAESIARFARAMFRERLPRFVPRTDNAQELLELVRSRAKYIAMRTRLSNHRETLVTEFLQELDTEMIATINQKILLLEKKITALVEKNDEFKDAFRLLFSIDGIGKVTAAVILAEAGDISRFESPKELAAFAGVTPRVRHSGTRTPLSQPISKKGNRHLRKALYMAALSAIQHNPVMKDLAQRLYAKGKVPKQVLMAIARRLLHIAFGVLRTQTSFDPNYKNIKLAVN